MRDILLAVSRSSAGLALRLFSLLVLAKLSLPSESISASILRPEVGWLCHDGLLLGTLLCARLAAALCDFVPPGEKVPESVSDVRRVSAAKASAREKEARLAL